MSARIDVGFVLLAILGIGGVVNGIWMQLDAPGWFARIAPDVVPFNVHFVRDIGAAYLATGAALVAAALRPAWRVPLVATALIFHGLHALGHVRETASGELASFHWLADLPGVHLPALVMLTLLVVYTRRPAPDPR
jgi:uncharacterized membrane protein